MEKSIEIEFIESWENTKLVISTFTNKLYVKMNLDFIKEIQKRGYDKKLRAGTALYSIIISRSKENGLRINQHHIRINALPNLNMIEFEYHDEKTNYTEFKSDSIIAKDLFESKEFNYCLDKILKQEID